MNALVLGLGAFHPNLLSSGRDGPNLTSPFSTTMAADLSSLLSASKALTAHLSKPDLPSVNLSLDQIEAQSRRLVSRQAGPSDDSRAYAFQNVSCWHTLISKFYRNYLLAQARVDAPALASEIAHLNTATTFTPLQALQDTDVAGYLRHAHEQNLISTIEEARKETQEEFYRVLEEREQRDWEAKKRRVFEELGGRTNTENKAITELKKSYGGKNLLSVSLARLAKHTATHSGRRARVLLQHCRCRIR